MALTARFTADFSQFEAALKNAQVNITTFERGIKTAAAEISKFASAFSGANIERQAASMAAAIESIGGATKLTSREQQHALATLDQLIEKYRVLGKQVPAEIEKVQRELKELQAQQTQTAANVQTTTRSMTSGFGSLQGVAKSLGPQLAATFTIGAVVNFGKSVVELGGQIEDLAAKTGFSTDAVQEFQFVAEQTGSSLDTFSNAAIKLTDKLATGDKSTVGALQQLGLSLEVLRGLSPEEAFTRVADAIKEIPDPMRQTQIALDLFGKTGAEVLPAIRQGFSELRDQARDTGQVLSKEAVKALAEFGDLWTRTFTAVKVSAATGIVDVAKSFGSLEETAKTTAAGLVTFFFQPLGTYLLNAQKQTRDLQDQLAGLKVPAPEVFAIPRRAGVGEAEKRAAEHIAETVKGWKETEEATKKAKAAAEAYAQKIAGIAAKLSGADQQKALKELVEAWNTLTPTVQKSQKAIDHYVDALLKLRKELGSLPPDLEAFVQANQKLLKTNEDTVRLLTKGTAALRDFSDMAERSSNVLKGLRADGLLPATSVMERFGLVTERAGIQSQNIASQIRGTTDSLKILRDRLDELRDFSGSIHELAGSFGELANSTSGAMSEIAGGLGHVTESFASGLDAGNRFTEGLIDLKGGDFAKGMVGLAAGGIQAFSAVMQATSTKSQVQNVIGGALSGAAAGAQIGTAIMPGIGTAIGAGAGAIAGALTGVFRGREVRSITKRVGREWGVDISQELAETIKETMKEVPDRVAATLVNFSKILEEAGGLSTENIDTFTQKLHDVFSALEGGFLETAQAAKILDENFGQFADHVVQSGELASKTFLELLELNQRFGTQSKAIIQFIEESTGRVGQGLSALAGPVTKSIADLGSKVDEARKSVKTLTEAGKVGTPEFIQAQTRLNDLLGQQAAQAATTAGELERLGLIALGAFNTAIANGADFLTAIQQIGPGLDSLIQAQQTLGITSENAALQQLQHLRTLINENQTLVTAAAALQPTLLALQQMGGLTAESFAALQEQGIATFTRLTEAGFSENEALQQMAGFLETVRKAHDEMGLPIDENTEALIDQAEAAGILKDEQKDATDIMQEGFADVTEAINNLARGLGVVIPDAVNKAAKSIKTDLPKATDDSAAAMERRLRNLRFPTVKVPIEWDLPEEPPTPPPLPPQPPPEAPESATAGTALPATATQMGDTIIYWQVDGQTLAQVVAPKIPGVVNAYGVA
jgi:predicted  nucleic acid-binding Zn-ribbon protein